LAQHRPALSRATAPDIFTAATIGGARTLGRDDLGRMAPGARADFLMVDIEHPAMQPLYDPVRSLLYAAGERAIRHVFVGGQQIVRDGKVLASKYRDASARLQMAQRRAIQKGARSRLGRARRRRNHAPHFPIEVSFRRAPIELSDSGLSHDRDWGSQQRPISRDDLPSKRTSLRGGRHGALHEMGVGGI
jgi:hypothetical protein